MNKAGEIGLNINGPKIIFVLPFWGGIPITETVIVSWFVILLVFVIIKILTRNLDKKNISSKQVLAEKLVITMNNLVKASMGAKNEIFVPYITALFVFSFLSSLAGLLTLRPPTADFNMTLTWALMTFFMIQYNGLKYKGLKGYLKSFFEPVAFLFPLNIISELAVPVSLSFRHFGNIAAGVIITQLIYTGLSALSANIPIIGQYIPVFQIGIPAILSVYFDLFSAFIQAFILISLTMVYVSSAKEK